MNWAHARRQDNRVAARGMQKEICQNKLWMSAGDIFLRMPAEEVPSALLLECRVRCRDGWVQRWVS